MFASLFTWLAGIFTASITNVFGAWKAVAGILVITILGVVLYNLIVDVVQECFTFALSQVNGIDGGSGPPSTSIQFVGLAGYLASHLKLTNCFAWIINVTLLKWLLAKIPFIKW
jgi:hypothetical protein